MKSLTYLDFAEDEFRYLATAYLQGMRYNAMVGQAQRICELYMKHVITKELFNNDDVMLQHNLRKLYDYITGKLGVDISCMRSHIMLLNNFYTHTRYPGRDAFMADVADVDDAFEAVRQVVVAMQEFI